MKKGRLITVRELAAELNTSLRAVYRLAQRVPHYRVGRQLRFDLWEVLKALREVPEWPGSDSGQQRLRLSGGAGLEQVNAV